MILLDEKETLSREQKFVALSHVYLEMHLSLQGAMAAAEADCRANGYREMELRFINHRDDLHRFYLRLGFHDTGVEEFPHLARMKVPFHFVQMAKSLF